MGGERSTEPAPGAQLEARVALDQIEALFGIVIVSVCGGAIAAGVLVATLHWLRAVNPWTGTIWVCWIVFLRDAAYFALPPLPAGAAKEDWQGWALWFTVICAAEGIGWGWASLGLVSSAHAQGFASGFFNRGRGGGGLQFRF